MKAQDIALDIIRTTKDHFYPMFYDLKTEIQTNWL